MEVVGVVGGALLSSLFSWIFTKMNSSRLLNFTNQNKVPIELQDWRSLLPQIQQVLEAAESQQTSHASVETWLSDLKDLAYDMEDILDQFEFVVRTGELLADSHESTIRPGCCPSLCSSRRPDPVPSFDALIPKVAEVASKLQHIDREKIISNFQQILQSKAGNTGVRTPSTSLVESHVYGREKDVEAIMELLLRHESGVCVMPIFGMGGLGKTTLAQLLYNDEKVKDQFDLRAWVCVSEEFDIVKVTRCILQGVTGQSIDFNDLNLLQTKLKEALGKNKFLLVLDDVWNENYEEWDILRRPFMGGAAGSTIIVTTRNHGVASIMAMGHIAPYALETLSDHQCLQLFAQHALEAENFEAHPHLEAIGKQLVLKCDGLPLAAKTLGGLLRGNFDLHYWEYILTSKIWDLPKGKSNIIPALRLSYHFLPSRLKRCFVYCAMFPKDWEFNKDELVLMWMAEGFLNQSNGIKRIEDICVESFDELLSRAFFQKSNTRKLCFVMHDLIHDLAQSIAGDSCLHLPHDLDGDQLQHTSFKTARHFSFIQRTYDLSKRFEVLEEAKRLRTFHALPNERYFEHQWLSERVLGDLLLNFPCLRILSLRGYQIKKIPDLVSTLTQLRYLDLSQSLIKSLPESVTSLIYMQTLILRECRFLKMLPAKMGNLLELKYLDIRDTDELKNIPLEILNMKDLQILMVNKVEGLRLEDLKFLSHLQGQLSVENLQNIHDAKEVNLERTDIKELSLRWAHDSDIQIISNEMQVLDQLKPHKDLEKFRVAGYGGSEFPSWIGNPSFSKLASLEMRNCKLVTSLPSVGKLPSLKELVIIGLEGLKSVGVEFYGASLVYSSSFPALVKLEFKEMVGWEKWSCFDGSGPMFPCLKNLTLEGCPKLRGEIPGFLTSLEKLHISGCPVLTASRVSLPSLHELEIQQCNKALVKSIVDLTSLQKLSIGGIPDLDDCRGWALPTTLKSVSINKCENLKLLPEEIMHNDGGDSNICFETLHIQHCPGIESFPAGNLASSLKYLILYDCQNLHSLPEPTNSDMLEFINISYCPKLKILPLLTTNRLVGLKWLSIDSSGSEEMIESLQESISLTPNLESIKICGFKYLKALPVFHSLISLTSLMIILCPMIVSFPKGCFPPNLQSLHIDLPSVKQQMHEWGLDRLTSLQQLTICSLCPPDGLHLPPTLIIFELGQLKDLKSISKGLLQSCTRLQQFMIWDCPKLEYLENDIYLPPSLGCFELWECPLLENKCKEEAGEYWPLLSHIPRLHIGKDWV